MLYVSKVNKKKKTCFFFLNNNKMPYMSEVIKNKGLEKKNDLFTYRPKSLYWMEFSEMDRNGWNGAE